MAEKLLQHKHCRNCGKAIHTDETFCGEDCQVQHREMIRKKRNQLYLIMAAAVIMMILALLFGGA